MPRTVIPFVSSMVSMLLFVIFIVMITAFVMIPQIIGGHPGELGAGSHQGARSHMS